MFETLVWITGALCVAGMAKAYFTFRDPFHPAMMILPMFAFIYVIMPMYQLRGGDRQTSWREGRAPHREKYRDPRRGMRRKLRAHA